MSTDARRCQAPSRIRDVSKNYGGLRPFRLQALSVDAGEIVAIDGLDRPAASVLTDLITGTALPDTGSVVIEGMPTSVLGEPGRVARLSRPIRDRERPGRAARRVDGGGQPRRAPDARDRPDVRRRPPHGGSAGRRGRAGRTGVATSCCGTRHPCPANLVRLGRAVALGPAILLVEHPTADLAAKGEVNAWAVTLRRLAVRRSLTTILVTADRRLARTAATRHLVWHASTGELSEAPRAWRRWIS